jgi:hypothetical protein
MGTAFATNLTVGFADATVGRLKMARTDTVKQAHTLRMGFEYLSMVTSASIRVAPESLVVGDIEITDNAPWGNGSLGRVLVAGPFELEHANGSQVAPYPSDVPTYASGQNGDRCR